MYFFQKEYSFAILHSCHKQDQEHDFFPLVFKCVSCDTQAGLAGMGALHQWLNPV
jgi:hypothetical protein